MNKPRRTARLFEEMMEPGRWKHRREAVRVTTTPRTEAMQQEAEQRERQARYDRQFRVACWVVFAVAVACLLIGTFL